jgi:replicative DNA helicase
MLRDPPHNLEAEQAVIGTILINNDAYWRVSPYLLEEHFFEPEHAKLYAACVKLIIGGRRATPIALKHEAKDPAYLGHLAAVGMTPAVAVDMGKLVRDLAIRRALITIGEELAEKAQTGPVDQPANELIEAAEISLAALASRGLQTRHELTRSSHRCD